MCKTDEEKKKKIEMAEVFNGNDKKIPSLPDALFNGCKKLQRIYLNNNKISELPEGLFYGCNGLKTIGFINNQISALPKDLFKGCNQ